LKNSKKKQAKININNLKTKNMSFNKVILIGRAGKDPEVKTLKDGKKVASFSLATNDYAKDKDGNQKTQWHNVTVWDKLADTVEKYLKKGAEVCVEGRIGYEDFEKDGVKRQYTRITATNFQFVGSKKDNGGEESSDAPAATPAKSAAKAPAKPAPSAPTEPAAAMADTDDDLPF